VKIVNLINNQLMDTNLTLLKGFSLFYFRNNDEKKVGLPLVGSFARILISKFYRSIYLYNSELVLFHG